MASRTTLDYYSLTSIIILKVSSLTRSSTLNYPYSLSLSYLGRRGGFIYISGTLTKRTLESRHPDPEASLHGQKNARAHDTRVTLVMNGIYSSGNIHYQKLGSAF